MKKVLVLIAASVLFVGIGIAFIPGVTTTRAQPAPDPLHINPSPTTQTSPAVPTPTDPPLPPVEPLAGPPASYYPPRVVNSADASGGVTIWATHTDERFQIGSLFISSDTAMTVTLYDGALAIPVYVGANGGACPNIKPGWQSHTQGNDLTFTTSSAGNITVVVTGESVWY